MMEYFVHILVDLVTLDIFNIKKIGINSLTMNDE